MDNQEEAGTFISSSIDRSVIAWFVLAGLHSGAPPDFTTGALEDPAIILWSVTKDCWDEGMHNAPNIPINYSRESLCQKLG